MSDARIPAPNSHYKPLHILDENLTLREVYGDGALRVGEPFPPLRQPVQAPLPRPAKAPKPEADTSTYSPIKHTLYSVQQFGFTHPSHGNFLMVPKEFQAILLLETKAVAAVVWEVMQQTIGWEDGRAGGRREWVHLTVRYFEREQLLSRNHAEKGIARALAMGYIERRRLGARGYEYRLRWKGTN